MCINDYHTQIPDKLGGATMSDMVGENGEWNWCIMQDWMSQVLLCKIQSILPPKDDYENDEFTMAGLGDNSIS